jgi:uncharacterized membrane protein YqjE
MAMSRPIDHISERRAVGEEPSLGQLFAELSQETTTLVRQEVQLAKVEMTQKATAVGKDVGFLAVGGLVAYAGFLALVATVIIALGQLGLAWWLSALIVGVVVAGIGGFLVMRGIDDLKNQSPVPQQTVETLREDQEWIKRQTS